MLTACDEQIAVHLLQPLAQGETQSTAPTEPTPAESDAASGSADESAFADAAADADAAVADAATIPAGGLVHHYDFAGEGTVVVDSVGGADGVIVGGARLEGTGRVTLDGVDDYIELPDGIISALSEVTIVVWLQWPGGPCWQRVFDFGSTIDVEDGATIAETSLLLTPASCNGSHIGPIRGYEASAMFHVRDNAYVIQYTDNALPVDEPAFVALAVDMTGLKLTVNGVLAAELPAPLHVEDINDVNNWLGRSQWSQDATFRGSYDEVRIYDRALTQSQLRRLYADTLLAP